MVSQATNSVPAADSSIIVESPNAQVVFVDKHKSDGDRLTQGTMTKKSKQFYKVSIILSKVSYITNIYLFVPQAYSNSFPYS